jgi:hypothetical protein
MVRVNERSLTVRDLVQKLLVQVVTSSPSSPPVNGCGELALLEVGPRYAQAGACVATSVANVVTHQD